MIIQSFFHEVHSIYQGSKIDDGQIQFACLQAKTVVYTRTHQTLQSIHRGGCVLGSQFCSSTIWSMLAKATFDEKRCKNLSTADNQEISIYLMIWPSGMDVPGDNEDMSGTIDIRKYLSTYK